ncbi:MAG: Holliday junction branch migration protein RuvA [Propionibacteriaceae bacterium]|jgi:Holliday junction DNA helicase RuvA|nr:Holliday junction branch migration protein RuvA [Propionibacteriaceae bacterium]
MIASVEGVVATTGPSFAVIEVSGIGLTVWCPPPTVADLRVGQTARLATTLVVREDALTLYGFATASDRDCFVLLQSASGVGPKLALSILTTLDAGQLKDALSREDVAPLMAVSGVGRKVAQRLILELKDKAPLIDADTPAAPVASGAGWHEQVASGLRGLGYSAAEAKAAADAVAPVAEADPSAPVGVLMRAALRSLAKG